MIFSLFEKRARDGEKSLALLIDPDDINKSGLTAVIHSAIENKVDYFFVGGSLITTNNLAPVIEAIKSLSEIPCVLFPGNAIHINSDADAILFLSLISGRNPELLIGQHVVAAPVIKRSKLEVIPTGYMLIHSGRPTSVSYMSNTQPIPNDKPSLAVSTAMAGEMLGLKCIYLDAGSGALESVPLKMIKAVKRNIQAPLIVGGGLNTVRKAKEALDAGADIIVIGNAAQKNLSILAEVSDVIQCFNQTLNVN
ncbi:geranylgeranylglyceryl/heptaprenylglyceryl phosphate synthase [Roseivirga echinicomitans]